MTSIINISEASYLAFHALALIGISRRRMTVKEIAEETGTSANHMSKVMQTMVRADIVDSVRGPSGGFMLTAEPRSVRLIDIYELFEGKITVSQCPFHRVKCPFERCLFNGILQKLSNEFHDYLKGNTIQDVIDNIKQGG
ncbi:MAG: Rrf2 family transcriptional regulator [bacterium]